MKKVLIALVSVLVLVGCAKTDYSKLEKELADKATKYYEDYIEGKVIGINNHKITLEALANSEVDIANFDAEKCDKASYALIVLTLNDKGEAEGEPKVETHLTCEDYESKNE